MKKRVNIQRDIESRNRISSSLPDIFGGEQQTDVEIVIVTENAESEIIQGAANDESPGSDTMPKKRRRKTPGDIQEV